MSTITLSLQDHSKAYLRGDADAIAELSDHLTFEAPGAKFDPRVKKGQWDGMIKLVHWRDRTVHAGLADRIEKFCRENGIDFVSTLPRESEMSTEEAHAFLDTLDVPEKFDRRFYQVEAFRKAVSTGRQLFLSPTSSGKSMIIYTLVRWYKVKTLIIVPTVGLVHQMAGDFVDYGCPLSIHKIQDGRDGITADVTVATWQSLYEQPPVWFDQFGLVIGDEAHLFAAKSLTEIMDMMGRCQYRFGFTGTLNGTKIHQLQLEGLFGPTTKVINTRELMDLGYVARLKMECVVLKHPREGRKELQRLQVEARKKNPKQKKGAAYYQAEIKYLYGNETRNRFIVKMATRLKGNTLILFHHIDHGDALFDELVRNTNRPVHLINGGVDGLERNDIRQLIESQDDAILVASVGTSSTGVSIRRINNMILASPWKSRIISLQSVGRGLRMAEDKDEVTIYDVADDLTISGERNHTLNHMAERVKIYAEEGFDYRVHSIDI